MSVLYIIPCLYLLSVHQQVKQATSTETENKNRWIQKDVNNEIAKSYHQRELSQNSKVSVSP